jgi:hypothetical protein
MDLYGGMKMKISMYELLGMVKDGKAPKKIKVTGTIYEYDEEYGFYFTKTKKGNVALGGKLNEINLLYNFNNEYNVEILEEEKKIPEKLNKQHFHNRQRQLANKINEIIDTLEMLNDKIK